MDLVKVEQLRDEVMGIKPVYTEIGNATDILLKNGDVVRDKRVLNSVVKALAASYAVDLKAQRRILQENNLSRKGVLPFYLGAGRVFIPLKMRHAVTEGDAVYGYVDLNYMGEPQVRAGRECLIPLSNGLQLQVFCNQSTVHGAQRAGQSALAIFQPHQAGDNQRQQIMEAGQIFCNVILQILEHMKKT